jgi:hypothetical protein
MESYNSLQCQVQCDMESYNYLDFGKDMIW